MRLKCTKIQNLINDNLDKYSDHISLRLSSLLIELSAEILNDREEIDLFELLVLLLLATDEKPISIIANLLSIIDRNNIFHLEESTIIDSAFLLRDHLKRDYIKFILEE